MKFYCVICLDLLTSMNDATIVSIVSCGHVFHEICALKWFQQSQTCPQCRSKCKGKNYLSRLYFNTNEQDESIAPDTNEDLDRKLTIAKDALRKKEHEFHQIQEKASKLKIRLIEAESELETSKSQCLENKLATSELRSHLKQKMKELNDCKGVYEENVNLKKRLLLLKNVSDIIQGNQQNIEEYLSSCGQGPEVVKTMATYMTLLKKELTTAHKFKQETLQEQRRLKREISDLRIEAVKKDTKINCLTKEVERQLKSPVVFPSKDQEENRTVKLAKRSLQPLDDFSPLGNTPVLCKRPRINLIEPLLSKKAPERNMMMTLVEGLVAHNLNSSKIDKTSSFNTGYDGLGGTCKNVENRRMDTQKIVMSRKKNTTIKSLNENTLHNFFN